MISTRKGTKVDLSSRYFDFFWGCPGCGRALSIGEVIERHCETCDESVEPAEISDFDSIESEPGMEKAV
ncbi:hypothetical protein [Rhizobium leucaenae]|uniref:Uncharacterized protein n=1 Tax=Rhizobium leucaenae TaxID=29450 RepID=A0A7W6ZV05_9HYPH|nr:hypothetical protein [Rhizobium leucaenae]MBB4569227.1 hypothetical protein [Rhizobium leucaenae]MBB6300144.1 hypothetical protein [Rhizobium leucaenae]